MSFELKIQVDPEGEDKEIIEETITKSHITKKLWTASQLELEIAGLGQEITKLQQRKDLLEEQTIKFTKEMTKE